MRPVKLVISAFGPYADRMPDIEFDKFSENSLFLISGDTGAGKTIIFDAICYALFGTVSGMYRGVKTLRSEYADEKTESFVDFYFSHIGKEYHILRKPGYERINRNGRMTEEPERVIFYYPDGRTEEGKSKVNALVRNLLKIDAKQFMQIVMIAQGEFLSLLNANTERRTEILRTIFRTDEYKIIEKYINRLYNASGIEDIYSVFDDAYYYLPDESYKKLCEEYSYIICDILPFPYYLKELSANFLKRINTDKMSESTYSRLDKKFQMTLQRDKMDRRGNNYAIPDEEILFKIISIEGNTILGHQETDYPTISYSESDEELYYAFEQYSYKNKIMPEDVQKIRAFINHIREIQIDEGTYWLENSCIREIIINYFPIDNFT